MDFGLSGKWALVCAASKGLGKGVKQFSYLGSSYYSVIKIS